MQYTLVTLGGDDFRPGGEEWVDGERLRDRTFLQQEGQAGPSTRPGAGSPGPDPDAGPEPGPKKKPSSIKVAMNVARKVVTSCWR